MGGVRMILFLAHTEADGSLSRIALEALSMAASLGEFSVGLAGGDVQRAADSIAGCGAVRVLGVRGDEFGQGRYASDAAAAEALCRASGANVVIAPHTSRWGRSLAGVAQRLGGRIDTHVTGITPEFKVTRWYYRQRMEATLDHAERPWIVLLEGGSAPAWQGPAGSVAVEAVPVNVQSRTTVTGRQSPKSDQQTIRPDASLLFVAGAGWTKKQKDGKPHVDDAARLILGFLEASQSSLGSSKSLVDLSGEGQSVLPFLSHLNQVGQTGSTPRHLKGLATCCHGEEPHVVGWRFIKERRAINLDASCGWSRGKADVLYVADAFEVMARVNELLDCGNLGRDELQSSCTA
jgi:electron transfer flavoprotein alpha subunit